MAQCGLFTDDPLVVGTTVVKAVHITELRSCINALRMSVSLGAYDWTDTLTSGTTYIQAKHITELRDALQDAYVAKEMMPLPSYTDPTLGGGSRIALAHIAEIRTAIVAFTGLPIVTVVATDPDASEVGPDTGMFTFARTGDTSAALNGVTYVRSGTATPGTDFTPSLGTIGTVNFSAGQPTATLTVTPVTDGPNGEGPETVILTVTSGANWVTGAPGTATVTIADQPTSFDGTWVGETDQGLPIGFTVTSNGVSHLQTVFNYLGGLCYGTVLITANPVPPAPITNNKFSLFVGGQAGVDITGTFLSSTSAAGKLDLIINSCPGLWNATWTAAKNPVAAPLAR